MEQDEQWPELVERADLLSQYEYLALWEKIGQLFPSLTEEERVLIASLVIDTCGSCHNAPRSCMCWNDE